MELLIMLSSPALNQKWRYDNDGDNDYQSFSWSNRRAATLWGVL